MIAVVMMAGLAISIMIVLSLAQKYFAVTQNPLVDQVNALLPQTQCAQCTYPGCKPYAQAIVENNEDINRCPPGGETTIKALANLLGKEVVPLNPDNGIFEPQTLVKINEDACIGCTLCIQACPVDAIVGATKHIHTVIADLCTGCNLCIDPCPVDCIDIIKSEAAHE